MSPIDVIADVKPSSKFCSITVKNVADIAHNPKNAKIKNIVCLTTSVDTTFPSIFTGTTALG